MDDLKKRVGALEAAVAELQKESEIERLRKQVAEQATTILDYQKNLMFEQKRRIEAELRRAWS